MILRWGTKSAAVRYATRRALGTPAQSIEQAAVRKELLCESQTRYVTPPRMSRSHAARVQHCACGAPVAETIAKALSPIQHDLPTVVYHLRDCRLDGRFLYSGMFKHDLLRCDPAEGNDFERLDTAVRTTTAAGSKWFGHFVHDELPTQLAAESLAPLIGHARASYAQEAGYRELFGLPRPPSVRNVFIKECLVVHDVGLNSHRRSRLNRMRERARSSALGSRRLYLRRREGQARTLLNEERLIERLVDEGFSVVTPAELDIQTLVQLCGSARIVVGVDGSHLYAPLFLLPPRAELLVIMPPLRFATAGLDIAQAMDFGVSVFVAETGGAEGTFFVNDEEFLRFLARGVS